MFNFISGGEAQTFVLQLRGVQQKLGKPRHIPPRPLLGQSPPPLLSPAPNPNPSIVRNRKWRPGLRFRVLRCRDRFKDVIDVPSMGKYNVNSYPPGRPSDVVYQFISAARRGKGERRSESGAAIPPRSCGVEGLDLNPLESGNARWFGKEA
jgi:hypothetical protein